MRKIKRIYVHCTDYAKDTSAQEIREWHLKRGFVDIGYHWVIRQSGLLEIGRPIHMIGAHAKGRNKDSLGVVLCGKSKFKKEQFFTLIKLLDNNIDIFGLSINDVFGHYEVDGKKTCPNFNPRKVYYKYK